MIKDRYWYLDYPTPVKARCITFSISINLDDISVEGKDILGDGVDIATRRQEFTAPDGMAITGRVCDDVRDRPEQGSRLQVNRG